MRSTRLSVSSALFTAALCLAMATRAAAQQVVPADSAAAHVRQNVTVIGTVASVSASRSGTIFVNFGAPYPNQTFTAVIFRSATARFPNAAQWTGKIVRVTGQIRLYRSRPEIVLDEPAQVSVSH